MLKKQCGLLTLYGSATELAAAEPLVTAELARLAGQPEPAIRLALQQLLESHRLKADLVYAGNSIWNRTKLVLGLNKVLKSGETAAMTKYLYQFLHLCCGSIAHYNLHGWAASYPTPAALQRFFADNEFGRPVVDYIPAWRPDARLAAEELEHRLREHCGR